VCAAPLPGLSGSLRSLNLSNLLLPPPAGSGLRLTPSVVGLLGAGSSGGGGGGGLLPPSGDVPSLSLLGSVLARQHEDSFRQVLAQVNLGSSSLQQSSSLEAMLREPPAPAAAETPAGAQAAAGGGGGGSRQ
jgi:hypothetical protein